MNTTINLNDYFRRISYKGKPMATLDTLRELHKLHTQTIPFENLNPLLGLPVKLDTESIQQKLVHDQRGGYCFEQNLLFLHVLKALDFSVTGLAARVLWNQPENKIRPRTHMLLLVTIEGINYIADVGFGGQTPTAPLLLESGGMQETLHEPFRLLHIADGYIMQTQIHNEWKSLYIFDLQEQFLSDYDVPNWYVSTHPESHFVTGLITSRAEEGCRYVLHNNTFAIHKVNGETERRTLKSVNKLQGVLENTFLLKLPETDHLRSTLEQLVMHQQTAAES